MKTSIPRFVRCSKQGRVPEWNRVRYEVFKHFGYFVTESSEHFAEYVPWFIKRDRPDLIDAFNIPLDEYLRRCEVQITAWGFMRDKLEHPEADLTEPFREAMQRAGVSEEHLPLVVHNFENLNEVKRSHEYGSTIVHSLQTGEPSVIYGNVQNSGAD